MGLYHNRIVVKVGTSTLTNEIGQNNLKAFDCIARVLSDIQNMGYEVILVSSGAIAVGINKLQTKPRPTSMRIKQAKSFLIGVKSPPVPYKAGCRRRGTMQYHVSV